MPGKSWDFVTGHEIVGVVDKGNLFDIVFHFRSVISADFSSHIDPLQLGKTSKNSKSETEWYVAICTG
jgi:hypothetical protein